MKITSLISLLLIVLLSSCFSTKKTTYFRKLEDTSIVSKIENKATIIQRNDLLTITVSSLNPDASKIFNDIHSGSGFSSVVSGTITQSFGYLVDQYGYIQFPILGNVKAEGLTTKALKDTIYNQIVLRKILIDPIVSVRYLNFKISVLGEVEHPAVYNIPNEKITFLEALTLAGDMTIYGKRNNVLLIREEEGQRKLIRLNLKTAELFSSPYYYLKSNDIIYIEHNRAKIANSRSSMGTWISALFSGSSLLIVIIDRLATK